MYNKIWGLVTLFKGEPNRMRMRMQDQTYFITGSPCKQRVCLCVQNIKKCMGILKSLNIVNLERFSFERRKVIGFAITMPHDWLKKLAPHFHPIRSKTKTNRNSLARVFPRFASATCNYYEF